MVFLIRNGGKSNGIYKSLNCGLDQMIKKINVKKNLKIVKNKINKNQKIFFYLHQIHSNKFIYIIKILKLKKKKIKADAIITNQKKLPIAGFNCRLCSNLIYDKKKNMIAAIHAGWKGAYKEYN